VLTRSWRRVPRYARIIVLALLTPLFEKNPSKTMTFSRCHVPMVLSMARVIVLLFAAAMLHLIRRAGVAGWPDATLSMAIVLALPLLSALERVRPEHTVALFKTLARRFGAGAVRTVGNVYAMPPAVREPSKYDDHRDDAGDVDAAGEE
jgi:hypothetical protein